MSACEAYADGRWYPALHTCDDPLACALGHLGPPEETEGEELRDLVQRVRELVEEARPSKLRDALLAVMVP